MIDEAEIPTPIELDKPFEEIVLEQNLLFEEFDVTTEDGYILKIHHIFSQTVQEWNLSNPEKAPVVFLQHGMFSCSEVFILNGEMSTAF
jgi:hypothetical protein